MGIKTDLRARAARVIAELHAPLEPDLDPIALEFCAATIAAIEGETELQCTTPGKFEPASH